MTVNKKEFVRQFANKYNFTQQSASRMLDMVTDLILDNMAQGNDVCLRGFGIFKVVERKRRECVNPVSKERIEIASHMSPKFIAGTSMRIAAQKHEADLIRRGEYVKTKR